MSTRHKHADVIIAWAEGKTVQEFNSDTGRWTDITEKYPYWYPDRSYRIKPEKKTPYQVYMDSGYPSHPKNVNPPPETVIGFAAVVKAAKEGLFD